MSTTAARLQEPDTASRRPHAAAPAAPPRRLILLLATACGLSAANLYYAQPLLSALRGAFHINEVTAGGLVTATQVGYALGLLFVVPLGDRFENRRLAVVLLTIATAAVAAAGLAPGFAFLAAMLFLAGTTLVVIQILVPFAAELTPEAQRGRVVGQVVSGLLMGVLLSRALGSMLADVTSWRVVYLVSASLMAVLTVVLLRALPALPAKATMPYGRLIRSTLAMPRRHPELRRRALYQAAMFAAFSTFWTTITYVLTAAPFHYTQSQIGVFALVGAAGAAIAPLAGRWADRGWDRPASAAAFVSAIAAFGIAGLGEHNVIALAAAAVLLDMAVQTSLVLGQQAVFRIDPGARARLNSTYMAIFYFGGALGSQTASYAFHTGGWHAVAGFGAVLPLLALMLWFTGGRKG